MVRKSSVAGKAVFPDKISGVIARKNTTAAVFFKFIDPISEKFPKPIFELRLIKKQLICYFESVL